MAIKEPWVSSKITCKLKNKPKHYTGFTSQTFDIVSDKPVPLSAIIVGFTIGLSEFCCKTPDINAEEIKEQLNTAAAYILNLEVHVHKREKEAGNQ